MPTVMLKRNWAGDFRRSVRNEEGEIEETLVFAAGVPVALTARQFSAVERDVGRALQLLEDSPLSVEEDAEGADVGDEESTDSIDGSGDPNAGQGREETGRRRRRRK